jgi:asparagine synthase (glutamine-hydrolysing)
MYAFCLIGADGRTWLVRDPFGIKPLYLQESPEVRSAAFASEWRALVGYGGISAELSAANAEELLSLGYTLGMSGKGDDLYRLPPGCALTAEIGGQGDQQLFISEAISSVPRRAGQPMAMFDAFNNIVVPSLSSSDGEEDRAGVRAAARTEPRLAPSTGFAGPPPPSKPMGEDHMLDRLDAVLEDSVRVHQRSDVPYGLFLSGGIDSSAIATLMARLNERPVTAFTCGFDAPGARDERAHAESVARALNLDWRETTFGEEDFWRILPEVAWCLDDPTTDYATLPTWKLAEAAKGTLTVVLSGEGGDELFGGYGRYRRALRPRWLGGRPAEPQFDAPYLKYGGRAALNTWRYVAKQAAQPWMTPLQRAQAADIATWLPNDLLLKLDRTLMAHGLEGRTPFLDREVAAFAFNLPDRFKVRGRYGKWLLRKWLEKHLPSADPWAKKKGFTVPVATWITPRARDLAPALAAHEGLAQVCDMEVVRAVFEHDDHTSGRWPLLFYAVWWNIHVAGMNRRDALEALLSP